MPLEELVLMPEVDARRALSGQTIVLRVLAPVGAYAGRGTLRVLRARPAAAVREAHHDEVVELVCGYEAYDRMPA
jgi:hypothetical protein